MVEPAGKTDLLELIELPRICLIGQAGAGKSTLANVLSGEEEMFPTSEGSDSCTVEVRQEKVKWLGTGESFYIVDTCGFGGDSDDIEEGRLNEFVTNLKKFTKVNRFVLVLNGQSPRFDKLIQEMLKAFRSILGDEVFKYIVVVHTRWNYDSTTQRQRQSKKKNATEDIVEKELKKSLREKIQIDTDKFPIPCFFVDSVSFTDPEYEDEKAKELLREEFNKLKKACFSPGFFLCVNVKEYESGKKKLKEVQDQLDKTAAEKKLLEESLKKQKEAEFAKFEKNHYEERIRRQRNIENKINAYFEYLPQVPEPLQSWELLQENTLYRDVTEVLREFNETDMRINTRFMQPNFERALSREINAKMPGIIARRVSDIVGEEFRAFAINLPHFSMPEGPNMLLEINNILTDAWTASAVIAAASVGVLAVGMFGIGAALEIEGIIVLGVVGIAVSALTVIALAGGVIIAVAAPLAIILGWSREKVINKLILVATNNISSNINFKNHLKELATRTFDIAADRAYVIEAQKLKDSQ